MAKSTAVSVPNLGVYLDRPAIAVKPEAMSDCLNVRVKEGRLTNANVGYEKFFVQQLNGPVVMIDNFFTRAGVQHLIFGTTKDLYQYDEILDVATFITPRYDTGTVEVTNGSAVVTGVGTLWDTSDNTKVGDEFHAGDAAEDDPTVVWYTILTVDSDTQITLTANYDEASAGPGIDYTIRKLFTADIFDYWRTETFPDAQPADEDEWFATNGIDDIVKWNGVTTQVTLLDTIGFKCKELARYKNMMIYLNLTLDSGDVLPFSIRNSAITFPENVTTLEAAEFVVHDGVDPIVGALPFGDNLFIYSERSITLVQFVGTGLLFAFRTGISGIGPLNGRLIADFGDFHEFLAADSQYRFDGISIFEIGLHVWRNVTQFQDPKRLELAFSHFDEENGELLWLWPRSDDPNTVDGQPQKAYVEHYLEEVGDETPVPYTIHERPFSAAGFFEQIDTVTWADLTEDWTTQNIRWNDRFFQSAFPLNLFGDENGFIYKIGTTGSKDGAAMNSFGRFGRFAPLDGKQKVMVKRIYTFTEHLPGAGYTLDVTLRGADQAGGTPTVHGPFAADLTHTGEIFVSPFKVARYIELEVGTNGINEAWAIQGYDFDMAPAGRR